MSERPRLFGLCLLALVACSAAQSTYIPYELGGENYYTMYGGPNLSVSISGTREFERGETVTLYVDLMNYGRLLGFKEDKTPQSPKEFALANAELQEEYRKTTALGITSTLVSDDQQIEVKSGDQVVQSLKSGDRTQSPLKYTIKIGEHAPSGMYPLRLEVSYDYQDNVRVDASSLSTSGGQQTLVNYRTSYIYQRSNQSIPIEIAVKRQADFEIVGTRGNLTAGEKKATVEVTYRNIGDEPVRDAVARLSIFKPFSSTDDQAFIGELAPGQERSAVFRLDVDSDATPKEYGISSEIKYKDVQGETVISESMKIPVTVRPAGTSLILPAALILAVLMLIGGYLYRKNRKA